VRLVLLLLALLLAAPAALAAPPPPAGKARKGKGAAELPREAAVGQLELVATFETNMPTGVTVSQKGRIFVTFPRWGDRVPFSVAEVRNGQPVAFPDAALHREDGPPADVIVSAQSVVVDPADRLWVLDTGAPNFGEPKPGGPKLLGVDLTSNRVVKTLRIPEGVALKNTYLNDVRFDLRRGSEGLAYVTDSGAGGIVVVDLASGKSWRRLSGHPSTQPDPGFFPLVEGQALRVREPGKPSAPFRIASDGIALSPDGKRLYYMALSSRRLYSVSADALADADMPEEMVAQTVREEGAWSTADGLTSDTQGRVYFTNWEHNALLRSERDGTVSTLAHDARLLWPDTLELTADGWLYVIANQLHRQARFHGGKDLRQPPYSLFRVKTDGAPVRLAR
jgi:sugar lactone lactonase YvrE